MYDHHLTICEYSVVKYPTRNQLLSYHKQKDTIWSILGINSVCITILNANITSFYTFSIAMLEKQL